MRVLADEFIDSDKRRCCVVDFVREVKPVRSSKFAWVDSILESAWISKHISLQIGKVLLISLGALFHATSGELLVDSLRVRIHERHCEVKALDDNIKAFAEI